MRIEKRFLAYGHELDTDISPAEVGLDFAVDMKKEFTGRCALQEKLDKGAENRIVSIVLDGNEGLPLGSGAIESSIRRVVNLRMKGNLIFWKEESANDMLFLRSYYKAGRWGDLENMAYIGGLQMAASVPTKVECAHLQL